MSPVTEEMLAFYKTNCISSSALPLNLENAYVAIAIIAEEEAEVAEVKWAFGAKDWVKRGLFGLQS